MIQIQNLTELTKENIPNLLNMVNPVLLKRKKLKERFSRNSSASRLFYSLTNEKMKIPFEQFITIVTSGYFAGKEPIYSVNENYDDEKNKLIEKILGKKINDKEYKKSIEIIIDYITKFNDDGLEHYNLTKNCLEMTSCYEVIWEDLNNEIRYKMYNPLQTVGIYDYSADMNLIGLVRVYEETNINNTIESIVELTDKNGTSKYSVSKDYKKIELINFENHSWGDVPAVCYESDYAIFETVIDLINAFEQVIQNNRNLFEYNDSGCKLKVKGYAPQNEMTEDVTLSDGTVVTVTNTKRIAEDKYILDSKVFYLGEDGDIEWISKNINDTATQNTIKTYLELITMMSCVPNITDVGFTNADNNSAIKNKYFALSQKLIEMRKGFEAMYLRRWELIFNRINLKKSTNFDFRDIKIELPVNIITNEQEEIDNLLKLQGIISDETLISRLGYNYLSESKKIEEETADDTTKIELNQQKMNETLTNDNQQIDDEEEQPIVKE